MTTEDDLRQAIQARTSQVQPSADALERIEAEVARAQLFDRRRRLALRLTSAAAVIALIVGVAAVVRDEDEVRTDPAETPSSTTTEPTTTSTSTTTSTTTTTTTFIPTVDAAVPIWPLVDSAQRFDDPVSAARSFAVDFVGMTDPLVGELAAGDARSGEVPVQPRAQGPVTTVFVRQLEDDTWFVIGASTPDIRLDTPATGDGITCPVHLTGEALAFEGVVQVAVRADGVDEPIGTGFVQGGGGPSAPFDGTVECDTAAAGGATHGAIILYSEGGEDYRVWSATVVRVALG